MSRINTMSKVKYTSNAEWPEGTIHGEDITTDAHDTREDAESVCNMLEKDGFGGDGEVFPIKTWVGCKTTYYIIK